MNEFEMQRLSFASEVRTLAQQLRSEAKAQYVATFCALNQRPASTPGETWDPVTSLVQKASRTWLASNTLDSFIPKALSELERIDTLIKQQRA